MKSLRLRISFLSNKIRESLPENNDLFGYLGISRAIILESLVESYDLLSSIAVYPDKFETIFAKREIAECIDDAQEYLNSSLNNDKAVPDFNGFLKAIAKIRFVLKETYISISNNPLRVDYEIAKAKEDLESVTGMLAEINTIKNSIDIINTDSKGFIDDLKIKHDLAIKNDAVINEFVESVDEIDENLTGTNEKIAVWKSEIQSIKEDIIIKQADISKLKKEIEQILEASLANKSDIKTQIESLNTQIDLNNKHQEHIQNTIEDVSRYGMAGSFKKRKDELKWAQWIWAGATLFSLVGLLIISYSIMEPLLKNGLSDINQLFFKIPIFASAVWLGWFCSRQYGFNTRIREDYAYKYAISMAFEGYKKETKDINPDLLEKLIELTIFNTARSPERIFNTKTNPGSPYNEMFDTLTRNMFGAKRDKTDKSDDE